MSSLLCLTTDSSSNIVSDGGSNYYTFNNETTYDSNRRYGLYDGTYTLTGISQSHPMAILNNDVSNSITYSVVDEDDSPIIIYVSGGSTTIDANGDYFTFKDSDNNSISIGDESFRFMRGRTYRFIVGTGGFNSNHSFQVYYSGSLRFAATISVAQDSMDITIPSDHSTTLGHLYYRCGIISHSGMKANMRLLYEEVNIAGETTASYDFYYGDVNVNVTGDFNGVSNGVSVYCYHDDYMGVQNLFQYSTTCNESSNETTNETSNETTNESSNEITSTYNKSLYCLTQSSASNIVNNNYTFNGETTYNALRTYGLYDGTYTLTGISQSHPMAILNNDVSNSITYTPNNTTPITIYVYSPSEDGYGNGYYKFATSTGEIDISNDFLFMRNKTYIFEASGELAEYPFNIFYNNIYTDTISENKAQLTFTIDYNQDSNIYYECVNYPNMSGNLHLYIKSLSGTSSDASYDFYYGDVDVTVTGDFNQVSVYCYNHGYMGGENLFRYSNKCNLNGTKFTSNVPTFIHNTLDIYGNFTMLNGHSQLLDVSMDNLYVNGSSTLSDLNIANNLTVLGHSQLFDVSCQHLDVSGTLTINDPVNENDVANKKYVDDLSSNVFQTIEELDLENVTKLDISTNLTVLEHSSLQDTSVNQLDVSSDLHVFGNFIVDGSFNIQNIFQNDITINNEILMSTQLDVSNQGTGPALKVTQAGSGDSNSVALFNAGSEGDALLIESDGNVVMYKDVSINGTLTINEPVNENDAANKKYVDDLSANVFGIIETLDVENVTKLDISTNLTVLGHSQLFDVSCENLDVSGTLTISEPVNENDAANKKYVDDLSANVFGIIETLDVENVENVTKLDISTNLTVLGHSSLQDTSVNQLDVSSDLHVFGNFIVDGSFNIQNIFQNDITINNEILMSTQLDISNQGTGPALRVTQAGSGDSNSVALFNAGSEGDALLIESDGNVVMYKDVSINGTLTINDPVSDNDAVNKKYVDDLSSNVFGIIEELDVENVTKLDISTNLNVGGTTTLNEVDASFITTTDLSSNSLTITDLVVNESLNIDNVITYEKYKQFDTIVIRRDVETDTEVINLRELQVWANDINIMVDETNTYNTYTADWFSDKNTAIGDHTSVSGLINNIIEAGFGYHTVSTATAKAGIIKDIPLTYVNDIQAIVLYNRDNSRERVIGLVIEVYNSIDDPDLTEPLATTNVISQSFTIRHLFKFPSFESYTLGFSTGDSISQIIQEASAITEDGIINTFDAEVNITGNLNVKGGVNIDTGEYFDTLVVRRLNGATDSGNPVSLRELQTWVNGSNILVENFDTLTSYFANWSVDKHEDLGFPDSYPDSNAYNNSIEGNLDTSSDVGANALIITDIPSTDINDIQALVYYNRTASYWQPKAIGLAIELYNKTNDPDLIRPLATTNEISVSAPVYRFDFPSITDYSAFATGDSLTNIIREEDATTETANYELTTFEVKGNASITGGLKVDTITTTGNVDVSGTLTINDPVNENDAANKKYVDDLSSNVFGIIETLDVENVTKLDISTNLTVLGNSKLQDTSVNQLDVSSDLHVFGNFIVDGSFNIQNIFQNDITINNEILMSTQLDVSNQGTGPALKVTQAGSGDSNSVALFNAGSEGDALLINSSGNITMYKNVSINGTLSVDNRNIASSLSTIDGSFVSVSSSLSNKQNTINSTSDISLNNLEISGNLIVDNSLIIQNLDVYQKIIDLSNNGSSSIDSTSDISLNNLEISENLIVDGNLTCGNASLMTQSNNAVNLITIHRNHWLSQNANGFTTINGNGIWFNSDDGVTPLKLSSGGVSTFEEGDVNITNGDVNITNGHTQLVDVSCENFEVNNEINCDIVKCNDFQPTKINGYTAITIVAIANIASDGSNNYTKGCSVTRTSTGLYTCIFSSQLPISNYVCQLTIHESTSNSDDVIATVSTGTTTETQFSYFITEQDNGTVAGPYVDREHSLSVFL